MSGALSPPLRSALKQPSRPGSPTSTLGSPLTSPQITRVPLPSSPVVSTIPLASSSYSPPAPISRTHSSSSILQMSQSSKSQSSPHPPPLPHHPATLPMYTPKVSFDTFENSAASMFSFTLQVKTDGYRRTRNTRVFLCASSPDESGSEALEWCLESLVQDGDELIVFRGVDEDVLGVFTSFRVRSGFTDVFSNRQRPQCCPR